MKTLFFLFVFWLFFSQTVFSQTEKTNLQNFPIVLSLQFHALAVPFKNLKSNFKNVGIGLGTEIYWGSKNWVQQVGVVWYRNKGIGNGLLFSTQTAWHPYFDQNVYGEVRAGLGYVFSSRPSKSFVQKNGIWTSVGKKGKGMVVVPVGFGIGYQSQTSFSPFLSYQMMLVKGYNQSVPLVPQTLIQIGNRINFSQN